MFHLKNTVFRPIFNGFVLNGIGEHLLFLLFMLTRYVYIFVPMFMNSQWCWCWCVCIYALAAPRWRQPPPSSSLPPSSSPSLLATPSSYFAVREPPAPAVQCPAPPLRSKQAAPLDVKSHRADWPLPPARDPTQPAKSRAVQTCHRARPCRRGSPRGGRSGQKLSQGSWGSPSGGGRTETPRKNSSGRTQLRHSWPSPPPAAAQSCGPAKAEF